MTKLALLALLATPYIDDCDNPSQSQCVRAHENIQYQQSLCSRLNDAEKQAESLCSQVVEWQAAYDQKCAPTSP